MFVLLALFLGIPVVVGVLSAPHAPVRAGLLAGWGSLTLVGFAPAGLFFAVSLLSKSTGESELVVLANALISGLAVLVALQGFVAGLSLLRRVARLRRREPEGSTVFLLVHHAAVFVVFALLDLIHGMHGGLTLFCLIACTSGALVSAPPQRAELVRPSAF